MTSILVIDDDGIVRDALNAFLTRSGYRVITAADGANGLLVFKNNAPDLVILDRNLPGITGSLVFDGIRRLSKDIPIIILSGYHEPEEVEAYLRSGAASFFSKGDGLSPVLAEVDRLLGARRERSFSKPEAVRPPKSGAAAKTGPAGSAGLVLIADDDPATRAVLRRSLSAISYTTLEAKDGAAALKLARAHRPDIVLLDISMPERNGLEVLIELAAEMPETGFVMITGNHDEALALECLKNGAFDYISKPVNLKSLQNVLNARLLVQRNGNK